MNLAQSKVGDILEIKKIIGKSAVTRRIMDMGLTKGTRVFVRKFAPFGDPVEISVRGYELSLRRSDAVLVECEKI